MEYMGNTKRKGREAPWPFRPTLPEEPENGSPSAWDAYAAELREHKAVYAICEKARNRNEAMRLLMIDGYRYRQANVPELERLAAIGREFEQVFGGVGRPGQVAALVDKLVDRIGVRGSQVPAPELPSAPQPDRTARIKEAAATLGDDDPLTGELG